MSQITKSNNRGKALLMLFLVLTLLALVVIIPLATAPNIVGNNHKNVTVQTYVNITNAKPEVRAIVIFQETNASLLNITINAGSTRLVNCNATIRDWNGFSDVVYVNATLYYHLNTSTQNDDNNVHYTNSSCTTNGSIDTYNGFYTCGFSVQYYANNGTWYCNVTAKDSYNKSGSRINSTNFYPVYALNVTDGINFGNVAVEDYSLDVNANITNFGNMPINISVEGYGVTRGDGLAMNCTLSGNISVENEKFALTSGVAYGSKTALSTTAALIPGLTMPKQTTGTRIINETYWQLYIPPNPAGNCTGYVLFSAQAS